MPSVNLDNYFEEHQIVPDVIRIDIEGAECTTIKGLEKTITDADNLILSIEWQRDLIDNFETEESMESCLGLLLDNGFVFWGMFDYFPNLDIITPLEKDYVKTQMHLEFLAVKENPLKHTRKAKDKFINKHFLRMRDFIKA